MTVTDSLRRMVIMTSGLGAHRRRTKRAVLSLLITTNTTTHPPGGNKAICPSIVCHVIAEPTHIHILLCFFFWFLFLSPLDYHTPWD